MNRRQFLRLGGVAGTASLAGCTLGTSTESRIEDGPDIALEPELSAVTFPTGMVFLPNGDRLVIERTGQVLRATESGVEDELAYDVSDQMAEVADEKGLLGIELHPDFPENRRLYLRYSGALPDSLSEAEYSHVAVLSEFEMREDMTGIAADSERRLLEVPEPGTVHNGGSIAFGPDGYLYVALGDGQRTNIGEKGWSWWYEQGQAAQNTTDNLLGGILRIDVDNPEGDSEYGIPSDNPLVDEEGRDEYYAWGLRNPYRISFDGEDLFVADVGEHTRESVYMSEKGANHGWPIVEGSSCAPTTSVGHSISENPLNVFNPKTWQALTNRISPVKVCPTPGTSAGSLHDPIVEYRRSSSRSVTGGYVYRGEELPELQGQYLFGDFIPPSPIFAVDPDATGERPRQLTELNVTDTDSGRLNAPLVSFARDPHGEVYVMTIGASEGGGSIRKITAAN